MHQVTDVTEWLWFVIEIYNARSSGPHPSDEFREAYTGMNLNIGISRKLRARTDVVRVELIHANKNTHSRRSQRPGRQRAQDREFAFVQIVNQDGVELYTVNTHSRDPRNDADAPRYGCA